LGIWKGGEDRLWGEEWRGKERETFHFEIFSK
jgi:hypothetical protein